MYGIEKAATMAAATIAQIRRFQTTSTTARIRSKSSSGRNRWGSPTIRRSNHFSPRTSIAKKSSEPERKIGHSGFDRERAKRQEPMRKIATAPRSTVFDQGLAGSAANIRFWAVTLENHGVSHHPPSPEVKAPIA